MSEITTKFELPMESSPNKMEISIPKNIKAKDMDLIKNYLGLILTDFLPALVKMNEISEKGGSDDE